MKFRGCKKCEEAGDCGCDYHGPDSADKTLRDEIAYALNYRDREHDDGVVRVPVRADVLRDVLERLQP